MIAEWLGNCLNQERMAKKKKSEKLVLIDGHALIHRAFHALPELTTKDGQLVNAAYGFCLIMLNALKDLEPKYGAVSFDLAKPTFRHKEYEEYKAKRKKTPKELAKQIPLIKKIVKSFNIPIYEHQGYEADDIVGSLAKQLTRKHKNLEVIIVTGDLDILQLVDKNISVYTMKKGLTNMIRYDRDKVEKRYGFEPKKLIDYKGLKGDPSDNLPGVEGVGDKTAKTLIDKHGTLEQIYEDLKNGLVDLSDRLKDSLENNKEIAFQSKDLATIRIDIKLKPNLEKMRLSDYDRKKVVKLFKKLEFRSLLNRLPKTGEKNSSSSNGKRNINSKYLLVKTKKELADIVREIKKSGQTTIDLETDGLGGKVVGMSLACSDEKAYYLSLGEKFVLGDLKEIIENKNIKKIGHGLKYDYRILMENGFKLKGELFDTMIAAYLINPERRSYKLDNLIMDEFGEEMIPLTDLMGKDYKTKLSQVDLGKVKDYACEDSQMTYRLFRLYKSRFKESDLNELFKNIEIPLIPILAVMESLGVRVSKNKLKKLKDRVGRQLDKIEEEIKEIAGMDFNLNSPLQLREVLYNKLGISSEGVRKTKTGLSTSATELEKIKDRHPMPKLILKYRQVEKIRNTYLEPILERSNRRVRTSFNQVATATGRLSSSNPNLQNIPTRSELGQEVRKVFVPQKGYCLVSLDYSQIELRVAAHLSGDKKMIEAFNDDQDIHSKTASELFDVKIEEVSKEQRDQAKTINFAVLYGMSSYGLSQSLNESREYASKFIKDYFNTFSDLKKYLDSLINRAEKDGYVETMLGRKRYFDLSSSSNRRQLERAAINTPIQGSAADIMKKAMIEIDKQIELASDLGSNLPRMILQVHDELIFEIRQENWLDESKEIKKIMESVVNLKVPLRVDIKSGPSWGEMKKKDV